MDNNENYQYSIEFPNEDNPHAALPSPSHALYPSRGRPGGTGELGSTSSSGYNSSESPGAVTAPSPPYTTGTEPDDDMADTMFLMSLEDIPDSIATGSGSPVGNFGATPPPSAFRPLFPLQNVPRGFASSSPQRSISTQTTALLSGATTWQRPNWMIRPSSAPLYENVFEIAEVDEEDFFTDAGDETGRPIRRHTDRPDGLVFSSAQSYPTAGPMPDLVVQGSRATDPRADVVRTSVVPRCRSVPVTRSQRREIRSIAHQLRRVGDDFERRSQGPNVAPSSHDRSESNPANRCLSLPAIASAALSPAASLVDLVTRIIGNSQSQERLSVNSHGNATSADQSQLREREELFYVSSDSSDSESDGDDSDDDS